jgi:hypothetical protein
MTPCFVKVGRFIIVKCTIGAVEGDQKHGSQVTEFPNILLLLFIKRSSDPYMARSPLDMELVNG